MASTLIGALRIMLGLETATFEAGSKRAKRELSTLNRAAGSAKGAILGLFAAVSVGSMIALAKQGLAYASSLAEVAQQLGVTTRDLQIYRYAATQTGISQEEMDKGLAKLTLTMGKAREGVAAAAKPFKVLSDLIGKDILKSAKTAGDAIPLIADAMAKIEDPTRRASLEMALFGKAGQKLDTLLAGGSAAINELAAAAEELGIVLSDEQIQRADETADKLEAVKMVLEARIAGVVADNADAILALVDALSQLVVWAGKAALAWQDFALAQSQRFAQSQADGWFISPETRAAWLGKVQEIADKRLKLSRAYAGGGGGRRTPRPAPREEGGGAGAGSGGGAGKKKKGGADDAERKRKEALRDEFERLSDIRRADIDLLRAKQDLAVEDERRVDLTRQILDLELAQERASLKLSVDLGDRSEAEALILSAKTDELDGLKRSLITQETEQKQREELAQLQDTDTDIKRQMLEGQAALAETEAERRRVELDILALAYEEKRRAEQRIVDDPNASAKDQQDAMARLAGLEGRQEQDKALIHRGTMGPMEAFLHSLPDTAEKAEEALQQVAVDGFGSLTDAVTETIAGVIKLGGVFGQVANQLIADIVRIGLQRGLSALLGQVGGQGGGGWLTSLFGVGSGASILTKAPGGIGGGLPKGFDKGGSIRVGGMSGIDRNLLSLNHTAIGRVSQGEDIKIVPKNDAGGGRGVTNNFQGNLMTSEFWALIEQGNDGAAVRGAMGGLALSQRQGARSARRRLR